MQKKLLVLILTLATTLTFGQSQKSAKILLDTTSITFRDTIFNIAFDSTSHNLGNIIPTNENENIELVKKFKYLGTDTIYIRKAWTGDPHFICEYPQEPLITNKIYSFTVCFFTKDDREHYTNIWGLTYLTVKKLHSNLPAYIYQ